MAHIDSKSRCWTWQLFVYISLFFTIQVTKEPLLLLIEHIMIAQEKSRNIHDWYTTEQQYWEFKLLLDAIALPSKPIVAAVCFLLLVAVK